MVKKCFVCKRPYEKAATRSYHIFPTIMYERTKWCQILGVEASSQRYTFLCSDHFSPDDFYIEPSGRRRLRKTAVPTASSLPPSTSSVSSGESSYDESSTPLSSSSSASECEELREKPVTSVTVGPPQESEKMVCGCCICPAKYNKESGVSFHRFPKDKVRLARWLNALEISSLTRKVPFICSKHFTEDSFFVSPTGKNILNRYAVPTKGLIIVKDHDYIKTLYADEPPLVHVKSETLIDPLLLPTSSDDTTEPPTMYHVQNVACEEVIDTRDVPGFRSDEDDGQLLETASYHSSGTATASESEMYMRETPADIYAKYGVISPNTRGRDVGGTFQKDCCLTPMAVEKNFQAIRQKLNSKTKNLVNAQQQVRRLKARVNNLNSVAAYLRKKLRAAEKRNSIPKVKKTQVEKKIDAVLSQTKRLTGQVALLKKKNDELSENQSQIESLKKKNDELNENQIHYDALTLENLELQLENDSLKAENRQLKSLMKHPV